LGTRHIDYNGRLCMVSAGTAYKLAYGVDRSPNPWADIPLAQVVLVTGANIYLPVRPGTDLALHHALLHVILRDHLEKRDFIVAHTTGFDAVAESVKEWTPARAAEMTGVPPDAI